MKNFDCDGKFGALDKVIRDDLFSGDKGSSGTSFSKANNKTGKKAELTVTDFIIISVFMFILALIALCVVLGLGLDNFTIYFLSVGIVEFMISIFCLVCGVYYFKKEKINNTERKNKNG